ncbi:MAG: hypothetical protein EA382_06235 [Spirochaetaceae bacterium]|nr:MAG: hypothetical protein EA382_06235 [Spirochaetaceae bacterium]
MSSRRGATAIGAIAVLALVGLGSCQDFFGTIDLKESIREEVQVATAPEVQVTVRPDPDEPGGTTSLSTTVQKVGVPFPISVTAFPEYAFTGWSEVGGTDAVSFAAPRSASTTALLTRAGPGIIIQANFTRRPVIEATDPFNFSQNVLKNKRIQLYFSKPMNPATINFGTISITHKPIGSGDLPVSIVDRYHDPVPDPANTLFTLNLIDGVTLEENHLVVVRVSRTVTDAAGHAMAADGGISFLVGTSADENPPQWEATNPFTVYRSDGTPLGAGNATNSRDLSLRPRAYDVEDRVQYLNLVETDGALTSQSQLLYQTAIPYSLQTDGDGPKTLTATLEDPSGNDDSESRQVVVTLDTQAPNAPVVVTPPASPTNVAVSFTVNATDQGAAGIAFYQITGGALTTPTSVSGSFSGIVPTLQGSNSITVRAVDNAGNIGPELAIPVVYDTEPPTAPTFTTPPVTPTNAAVSFQVTATDTTTGIDRYVITSGAVGVPIDSSTGSFSGITPAAQGTNSITVRAVDAAGNPGPTVSTSVEYDSLGPLAPTVVTPPASPTSGPVSFRVTAVDQGSAGVASYRITGGATTTHTSDDGWFVGILPAAQGTNSITVHAVDTLGNVGATLTIPVVYDTQAPNAPVVVTPPASPTNVAVSFTVNATDQGAAGIAFYQITGGALTTPTSVSGSFSGIVPTLQGSNSITVRAVDNAGNIGPELAIPVVYDTEPPTAPTFTTPPVTPTNAAVSFQVTATDTTTGIDRYVITSGAVGVPIDSSTGSFSGITPAAQGTNSITVRAVDAAGNPGPTVSTSVEYDSLGPLAPTVVTPPASPTSGPVSFRVTAVDQGSAGVASYRITGGATTTPTSEDGWFVDITPAAPGMNLITVIAVDALGNEGLSVTIEVVYNP